MLKVKELIKRIKLPAKASVYYLIASTAGKVVSFIITPFSTRLLGKEAFGQFSLYMALLGGVSVICSAITSGSAVYKGLRDHSENRNGYLRSVLAVNLVFSVIICILLFAFSRFFGLERFLLFPLTLQISCDGATAVALSFKRFDYKYKTVTAMAIISAVTPPVIAIYILSRLGGGYIVRIYSLLFVSICLAVYSLTKILFKGEKAERGTVKYIVRSSVPLLPHSISSALSVQADKLIITSLMGAAALAKYTVVYSLGIALQFTVTSIGAALGPWIIRRLDANEGDKVAKLILPMIIGYCALSLCLIAVGPEAMRILAPSEYLDALPALLPIAMSTPFYFISSVTTVGLVHANKGKYTAIISVFSAIICIILNYTLIGRLGFLGAGLVTFINQATVALSGAVLLSRVKLGNIVNVSKIALPCLVSIGVGTAIYMLRNYVLPRIIILLFPAVMLLYCLRKAGELVLEKDSKIPS